jgi:PAS domain S-box-containing protein
MIAAHESNQLIFNNIIECLPTGLLVINADGVISIANELASKILGYPLKYLLGKGWFEIFFDDINANISFHQVIVDVINEQKQKLHREAPYTTPSGQSLYLSVTTSYLCQTGQIAGIVILIEDITDFARFHERQKIVLAEKHRVQKEKTDSLNKLALSVAHEIRNPSAYIGGFAKRLLNRVNGNVEYSEYLQCILNGANKLEAIVKAVNEYASIAMTHCEATDLTVLVKNLQDKITQRAEKDNIQLAMKLDILWATCWVDAGILLKALEEICINALDASIDNSCSIDIMIQKYDDALTIVIKDNGNGISDKDKPFVFDPFFSTKPMRIGMGLCKTERIVKEHGGSISIKSVHRQGVEAIISLPYLSAPIEA